MVVNITTIHFHYQVVTILGSDVHFNSSDVHYSVFAVLYKHMMGLLTIPVSNADSERGFSMLRKVQTGQRSSLSQSTIVALMSIKFNNECCCFNLELPEDLLKDCKKATTLAVKK